MNYKIKKDENVTIHWDFCEWQVTSIYVEQGEIESVCFAPSIKYVPKECLTNGSIDGIKVCDCEDKNEGADTVVVCIN